MIGVFISVLATSTHTRADGTTMAPLSDIHHPVDAVPGSQWGLTVTVTSPDGGQRAYKFHYSGQTWPTIDGCIDGLDAALRGNNQPLRQYMASIAHDLIGQGASEDSLVQFACVKVKEQRI
jgi:hypothetical protein